MSTQKIETAREHILAALDSKVRTAAAIAEGARKMAATADGDGLTRERQVMDFVNGMAREEIGLEIAEVANRVRKSTDPLQELAEWQEEFTQMVFRYGNRIPSEMSARSFAEKKHMYLIEATREIGSILKAARRELEK